MRRNGRVRAPEPQTRTETLGESSVGPGLDEDDEDEGGGLRRGLV